jgi:uncharacterized protein YoxC
VSGAEVAGLVVAVFWAVLVAFLCVVLTRTAGALKETTRLVAGIADQTVPLLGQAAVTLRKAGTQLDRVDSITADAEEVAANASALSGAVHEAIGVPLTKVAAFGYGVRRATKLRGSKG